MARQLLPTDAELGGLDTVERVCTCAGLQPAVWRQFSNTLGGCTQLRVFATLPQHTLQEATSSARIPPTRGRERPLSAVEIIQVALTWHFARLACGLVDNDPLLPDYATASTAPRTAGGGGGAAASSAGASSTKNVK